MIYKVIGKHLHYQLRGSTGSSGTHQEASLARGPSEGVGQGREEEEKMATGGKWECKVFLDVLAFVFLLRPTCAPFHSFLGVVHTGRSLTFDFFHPYFWCSHCFSMNPYLFFSCQQICFECLCIVCTVLVGVGLVMRNPLGGIESKPRKDQFSSTTLSKENSPESIN